MWLEDLCSHEQGRYLGPPPKKNTHVYWEIHAVTNRVGIWTPKKTCMFIGSFVNRPAVRSTFDSSDDCRSCLFDLVSTFSVEETWPCVRPPGYVILIGFVGCSSFKAGSVDCAWFRRLLLSPCWLLTLARCKGYRNVILIEYVMLCDW